MLVFIGICGANPLYQVQNCSRERGGGGIREIVGSILKNTKSFVTCF